MKQLFTLIFMFLSVFSIAQKGIIRGTVYEDKSGESLVGVTIFLKGTTQGTISDLDGKFSMETEPGVYDVRVSYISYQTITIEDVEVQANEVTLLNNIRLKSSQINLNEVVVTAKALRSSETALTTIRRKAAVIMDGVSSEKIELIGDATAAEAVKRVTGVSVEDGKYFYVRGLGDRYSKSMLNGVTIPGLDPDKNTLQMDIFPSGLLANMTVNKTFTADLPADFTGGLLNIETKDFPDRKIFKASVGTSFNPSMHFNPDFLSYEGGSTDFLGFDDGTRALPDGADNNVIPTPISGASPEEVNDFIHQFSPNLAAQKQTSLMDISASLTTGNQIDLKNSAKDAKLGYIFSLNYKHSQNYYDDIRIGEYQRYIDPEKYEMRYATTQQGLLGESNALVGALAGVAYKTNITKFRLTAMHLQNGVSSAGKFNIQNDGQAVGQSGYTAKSDNLGYNQRSLTNILLAGEHQLQQSGWKIDWKLSPTYSVSNDPDLRKTAFTLTPVDTLFVAGAGGNPARIWRSLNELSGMAKIDITKDYSVSGNKAELKFGASHTYKQRDYEILFFDIQFFGGQNWPNPIPEVVLNDENLFPNSPNSVYYQSGNNTPNPNAYESNVNNTAFYVSNTMDLFPGLKSVLGLRMENYVQRHTGRDQRYASGDEVNGQSLDNDKVLESLDFFPAVNLIYALSEKQNLRASATRTIARPTFKELSFAQILDPVTNRIFNGSLFKYTDWNGELTETRIMNYDLRWEMFLEKSQIFSVSAFYKEFDNPIELVRIPEQQTSTEYQPRNVGDGLLYGVELEFNKNLDFLSPSLSALSLNGNLTLVESKIDMTDSEFNSRKTYEKSGQEIDNSRAMAGQSPYVVNAGLTYNNYENGIAAGLFYNVKGETLIIVGGGLFPDIYSKPFHSLNVSFNKKIGDNKKTMIELKASNLLGEIDQTVYQSFRASDQTYYSKNPGTTFSIGIKHSFN